MFFVYYTNKVSSPSSKRNETNQIRDEIFRRTKKFPSDIGHRSVISRVLPTMKSFWCDNIVHHTLYSMWIWAGRTLICSKDTDLCQKYSPDDIL